jgi:hypothetical protein
MLNHYLNKTCNSCGTIKSKNSFYRNKTTADGFQYKCKECSKQLATERRLANKDKNTEYRKTYYISNKTAILKQQKNYRSVKQGLINANKAKRRADKLKATPNWSDKDAIRRMYIVAKFMNEKLGEDYQVDHVIPLKGKSICGLHCETNLQLLSARENRIKGSSFNQAVG